MMQTGGDSRISRYEPLRALGEGSYGRVVEARDRATGTRVALKELHHVDADSLTRFKREFRAAQKISHPNLVRLDALFEDHGRWMIAMELVEGTDLLGHLRPPEATRVDDDAVRNAFLQLSSGLSALHGSGLLHRDLKPSNVRVTPEGRVVLLDFGLTTTADPRAQSTHMSPVGTVAYMAPEQADGMKLRPAADWYAFGVCLYEALTGRLPIEARMPLLLLVAKQQQRPLPASERSPEVPQDLSGLCDDLLAIDPAVRPSSAQVDRVLRRMQRRSSRAPAAIETDTSTPFEGRQTETAALARAFEQAARGSMRVVLVEGESGIGKSALIECFLESVDATAAEPLVLTSRCYENELFAYKAFDEAIEGLSRHLRKMPADALREVLPPRAALLCQLFPALGAVQMLAESSLRGMPADPSVQRIEAFAVLAQLLTKVSAERPIVLSIDDLQWADAESFRLLRSLLESALPGRILVIAAVRPERELEGAAVDGVRALSASPATEKLTLVGLPRAQARSLAQRLLGATIPEPWVDSIAGESEGHPLFLTMLARFAESHDPRAAAELTLDAAIGARIGSLSRSAQDLLETIAIVASPLPASLCASAAGVSAATVGRLVTELCGQRLLRRRGAGEVACFHDRVRRVVTERLARPQTREIHARIADVLASQGTADPAQLGRHYEGAGQLDRAAEEYRRGGDRALAALAFALAEALYAKALELGGECGLVKDERVAVLTARGHALARGGRSADAARIYRQAAEESDGDERIRLRMWAAQHLLQSAQVDEGKRAARALLAEIGVPLASSDTGAIARLIWDRTWLGSPDLTAETARRAPITAQDRMQLDAMWGLAQPLSWFEPIASASLNVRYLRRAQSLGEPAHMARALAEEAFARVVRDPRDAEVDRLLVGAHALATKVNDPALEVSIAFRECTVATYRWDMETWGERSEHAHRICLESCPEQPWLLTNLRMSLGGFWANRGDHGKLRPAVVAWLSDARDRNDQFAASVLEGFGIGSIARLMPDEPDVARDALEAAFAPWPRSPFTFAHIGYLIGVAQVELYRGGAGALCWMEQERQWLASAHLLRWSLGRISFLTYHALAALAAQRVAPAARAQSLLEIADAECRQLSRLHWVLAQLNVPLIEAQIAALRGQPERALERAREARERNERCESFWRARSAEYLEGVLEGGDAGLHKREHALAFFAEQGWTKPRQAIATFCPVVDALEA
jgi:hypothetical protein